MPFLSFFSILKQVLDSLLFYSYVVKYATLKKCRCYIVTVPFVNVPPNS